MNGHAKAKLKNGSNSGWNICTCDALTIAATNALASSGFDREKMHAAILQKWEKNVGKFPDGANGTFKVFDKDANLRNVTIRSQPIDSFDPQYFHVLVTRNHHDFGNHCLFVIKRYMPDDGDFKGQVVYRCDDDVWGVEKKQYDIPVDYHGNILYRVSVACSAFDQPEKSEENGLQVLDEKKLDVLNTPGKRKAEDDHVLRTPEKRRAEKNNAKCSPKRKYVGCHGYIDGVTRIFEAKSGKTEFFRFSIVSEKSDCTVVCFDKNRHQELLKNNSNIIYEFENLSYKDGEYTMETKTCWNPTSSNRRYKKHLTVTPLASTTSEMKIWSKVHIAAIMYNSHELSPTRKGIRRTDCILQDDSGFMRCTIFGKTNDLAIHADRPYKITHLWLTHYKGRRVLSTTEETEFLDLEGIDGVGFDLDYVLSSKRDNVGILNFSGRITSTVQDETCILCPDCKAEVRDYSANEDVTFCDNESCETEVLSTSELLIVLCICFRFMYDEDKKPLLRCPSYLLDELLGLSDGYSKEQSRKYKSALINKHVNVSFDSDDYSVTAIKI